MTTAQTATDSALPLREPPKYSGGLPLLGHILPFAKNPYRFMEKVSNSLGEIAQFKIFRQRMVLLTGDHASKLFYRSSDDQLDQSAAYKLMTPIFGQGIIFDAPDDIKNQQLKMLLPMLRMDAMHLYSDKIAEEVQNMVNAWGDEGEIDIVREMVKLTINTATHCLLGKEFRFELTEEFADIYHDLELGVNPLAYSFPNLPLPAFKKRDRARTRLQELVSNIIDKRNLMDEKPEDMIQVLIESEYAGGGKLGSNEITGLLIAVIFAGHHTSSGTSAWVLLELLKHPEHMRQVREELDQVFGKAGEVNFEGLKQVNKLENVLKEVLRLHPPLILLMRQVKESLTFKNYRIRKGDMVWASPPVTHRMDHLFTDPEKFDPDRFSGGCPADKNRMAYQPFGGGRHKCSGNAFAMFQIKAIFSSLLRHYDFELIDPADTYQDDYQEMIVQPKTPSRVRYRLRR